MARRPASLDPKNTIKITIEQLRGEAPFFPTGSEQLDSNDLFKNSITSRLTFWDGPDILCFSDNSVHVSSLGEKDFSVSELDKSLIVEAMGRHCRRVSIIEADALLIFLEPSLDELSDLNSEQMNSPRFSVTWDHITNIRTR
jgi:hypothetical protein